MKTIAAMALALCLAGCADSDFFGESTAGGSAPPPAPEAAAAPAPVSAAAEATPVASPMPQQTAQPMPQQTASPGAGPHCTQIAVLRARDAAYAGEDSETQQSVHDRTYAECMAWDARHRS